MKIFDVIIVGAGAAGMMCAIEAAKRGRSTLLLDHNQKIAEKIRISGGGRCNFTNTQITPQAYLSKNPHFCKSALAQFTQNDFLAMVQRHGIAFHEKKLGQLFCDGSSQQIIDMLMHELSVANVSFKPDTTVDPQIRREQEHYQLATSLGNFRCASLVIATGGLSIPKIGASKFGYQVAERFGLNVIETRPALVPLTFQAELLTLCKHFAGLSIDAQVSCRKTAFREGLLFTHRGLSGPSILQLSSYWKEGEDIVVNMAPDLDVARWFLEAKQQRPKRDIKLVIHELLPQRLGDWMCEKVGAKGKLAEISDKTLSRLASNIQQWRVRPSGTEGYRTAEVTLGGMDTHGLSSQTMEAKKQPGLFFIGEVVDVTGHLGGYNFQWAWSSGYAAGQAV